MSILFSEFVPAVDFDLLFGLGLYSISSLQCTTVSQWTDPNVERSTAKV